MSINKIAQRKHRKALRRKNKKYTGPKYSQLEMVMGIAPLLERAGIKLFDYAMPEGDVDVKSNTGSTTSFI
jgi:hypothetical protein